MLARVVRTREPDRPRQIVVVENSQRTAGGTSHCGDVGGQGCARRYTLFMGTSTMAIQATAQDACPTIRRTTLHPGRWSPAFLSCSGIPSLPVLSVTDLIRLAKESSARCFFYGVEGVVGPPTSLMELMGHDRLRMTESPYKAPPRRSSMWRPGMSR